MNILKLAVVSLFALISMGCTSALQRIEVRDRWSNYAKDHAKPPPTAQLAAPALLVATESLFVDLSIQPKGRIYEMKSVAGTPPSKDQFGYLFLGGGTVLAQAIERSVAGKMRLSSTAPVSSNEAVVTPMLGIESEGKNTLTVYLRAQLPSGAIIDAKGSSDKRSLLPHLAWWVPIMIISGLALGLAVVSLTSDPLHRGLLEKNFVEAADRAAAALAAQITALGASNGPLVATASR